MLATAEKIQPEETVASLFGPEVILPSQFSEQAGLKQSDRGEKRLMLAVLTDAVRWYQVGCDVQSMSRIRAFREAEEWLFSAKGYGPFSFKSVCHTFDITPEYLRTTLRKWRIGRVGGVRGPAVRRSSIHVP